MNAEFVTFGQLVANFIDIRVQFLGIMNDRNISRASIGGGRDSGNIFHTIISLSNILSAWKEFSRGKKKKKDVASFEFNFEDHLLGLHEQLSSKTYAHDPYTDFFVCDPKKRHIHKASVRDRVLYQAIYRVLYPVFDRHFIFDVFSSRNQKGLHLGVNRLTRGCRKLSHNWRRPIFALKCDVRKFFDSIDHEILKNQIFQQVKGDNEAWLIESILGSFEKGPGRGLPLGNVTSQLFANVYLNDFDQFIKHKLKEKYYFRYCDDFIILSVDKLRLENIIFHIRDFLSTTLNLELHPNKIEIRTLRQGIDFLGYVVLPNAMIMRTSTQNRIINKVMSGADKNSLESYLGILSHCRAKKTRDILLKIKSTLERPEKC